MLDVNDHLGVAIAVRDFFGNDPSKWTKSAMGREEDGDHTYHMQSAKSHCVFGARGRVLGDDYLFDSPSDGVKAYQKRDEFASFLGFEGLFDLVSFNNAPETTFEMMMERIDRAIEATKVPA